MSGELKAGGYGCVRIPGWYGWLIRKLTRSDFNHSFILLGGGKIAEATPRGMRVSDISEYAGLLMVFDDADQLTDEQRAGIADTARTLAAVRIRYGFPDILWLGLHLMGFDWAWLMSRVLRESRQICSQAVAFCGEWNGVPGWKCGNAYAQETTPGQLAARCARQKVIRT